MRPVALRRLSEGKTALPACPRVRAWRWGLQRDGLVASGLPGSARRRCAPGRGGLRRPPVRNPRLL